MLGSLRLVDPKAAGAQTLRLVTALVVSVAVTGAVTGPLAYRAVEFRSDVTRELAAETAPSAGSERAVLNGTATRTGDNARGDAASTGAPSGTSGSDATPISPPSQPGSGVVALQQAGADPTTTATENRATDGTSGGATTSPGENGVSPATASRPPAVITVAGSEPVTTTTVTPPGTTAPAGATTTTRNPLDEFNPRPSCDDKAQELNAEDRLACASTSPGV